jgi:hypothetical protein
MFALQLAMELGVVQYLMLVLQLHNLQSCSNRRLGLSVAVQASVAFWQ